MKNQAVKQSVDRATYYYKLELDKKKSNIQSKQHTFVRGEGEGGC